ncbi:MAG: dihydrolipoamide acetyltransferase family protein [Myxococcota bacterium]
MAYEFKLPDIGEGVVEGEIVQWLVKPGDPVEVDQPMVEVMTDKATVVIASPVEGKVVEVKGGEGDLVEVHSIIAVIDDGSRATAPEPVSDPPDAEPVSAPPASAPDVRVLAAPATRRLARELGIDLTSVEATGPGGRVSSEDVRRYAAGGTSFHASAAGQASGPPSAPAPAPTPGPPPVEAEDQTLPVRGLRRRIWDNMARSTSTAAHFTFVEECDTTELVQVRRRFNERLDADEKLSFLPFILRAVVTALREFPDLNGQLNESVPAFVRRARHDIGIAVSSDKGLTVPVLRDAGRYSLLAAAREVRRLAEAVREGRTRPEDLGGSSFTITSLGRDGGLFATPVINHPEVAILGVHRMRREPRVFEGDELRIRDVMNLSLSFDHRWIDGHVGAAFAYRVIELLETPDRLFMES